MSLSMVYLATVVLSLLILAAYLFMVRKKNLWFVLLFASVPIVNSGYYWLSVSTTTDSALWANRVSYLGSVFLPMAMLMIILNVTKLQYKRWFVWMLFGIALAIFAVAASPGWCGIYYKSVELVTINGITVLDKEYGILHPLYLFYLLGYFTVMVAAIIHASVKKTVSSNAHAVVLALAVFVNIGVWLFEQLSRIDFEFLSVSYIISELFLLGLNYVIQEQDKLNALVRSPDVADTSKHVVDDVPPTAEQLAQFQKGLAELTKTEHAVFDLYIQGQSTKEVLSALNIKENTLKYHNKNIYSKLGVKSRKQLRELANQLNNTPET